MINHIIILFSTVLFYLYGFYLTFVEVIPNIVHNYKPLEQQQHQVRHLLTTFRSSSPLFVENIETPLNNSSIKQSILSLNSSLLRSRATSCQPSIGVDYGYIVITGSNGGIGLETVRQLIQYGNFHIIMACRNVKKALKAREIVLNEYKEHCKYMATNSTMNNQSNEGSKGKMKDETLEYQSNENHCKDIDIKVLPCDTSDLKNMQKFFQQLVQYVYGDQSSYVRSVIMNAGVLGSPYQSVQIKRSGKGVSTNSNDMLDYQLATNYIGHAYFALEMVNYWKTIKSNGYSSEANIKEQSSKMDNMKPNMHTIVMVASDAHSFMTENDLTKSDWKNLLNVNFHEKDVYDAMLSYSYSKTCQIAFCNEISKYIEKSNENDSNIKIYSVHPGVVHSNITTHVPYVLQVLNNIFVAPFIKNSEQGSYTSLYVSLYDHVNDLKQNVMKDAHQKKKSIPNGSYWADCKVEEPSKLSKNTIFRKRLLEETMKVLDGYFSSSFNIGMKDSINSPLKKT